MQTRQLPGQGAARVRQSVGYDQLESCLAARHKIYSSIEVGSRQNRVTVTAQHADFELPQCGIVFYQKDGFIPVQ